MNLYGTWDRSFCARFNGEVWETIVAFCQEDFPRETGGILVGFYSDDLRTATITCAVGPPLDSSKAPTRFERGIEGLSPLLRRLWRRPGAQRRYYLGEWHLHPNGLPIPSRRDDRQMASIAAGAYRCPEPLLLLVGGNPVHGWVPSLWVYPKADRLRLDPPDVPDPSDGRP